jgi:hypothetical protein
VVIGISDDLNVEIISGLEEGQQIVVRTLTGTAAANTTSSNSTVRGTGGPSGGAVFMRGG